MLTAEQIIAEMKRQEESFSCQDNVTASIKAHLLRELIRFAESGSLDEVDEYRQRDYEERMARKKIDAVMPDLETLKRKYSGK